MDNPYFVCYKKVSHRLWNFLTSRESEFIPKDKYIKQGKTYPITQEIQNPSHVVTKKLQEIHCNAPMLANTGALLGATKKKQLVSAPVGQVCCRVVQPGLALQMELGCLLLLAAPGDAVPVAHPSKKSTSPTLWRTTSKSPQEHSAQTKPDLSTASPSRT